jgi:hypothetical protein
MGKGEEDEAGRRCDDVSAMDPRNVAPNARAAVFAAVCTLLAVAAHRVMSAAGIPLAAEAFGAVAVFCFARIAAGLGERGLAAIGLLVGGSQIGLHLLFHAVQASAGAAAQASAAAASTAASVASAASAATSMPGMDDMPGMSRAGTGTGTGMASAPALLGTTTGMTIAHVLAAAVAAWWLRRGEAALFGAVERARVVLGASWRMLTEWVAGTRLLRTAPPLVPAAGLAVRRPAVARVLLFAVIRRGPPPAVCR